jgi:hypothetical protein
MTLAATNEILPRRYLNLKSALRVDVCCGVQPFGLYLAVGGLVQSVRNVGNRHVSVLSNSGLAQHSGRVYPSLLVQ